MRPSKSAIFLRNSSLAASILLGSSIGHDLRLLVECFAALVFGRFFDFGQCAMRPRALPQVDEARVLSPASESRMLSANGMFWNLKSI